MSHPAQLTAGLQEVAGSLFSWCCVPRGFQRNWFPRRTSTDVLCRRQQIRHKFTNVGSMLLEILKSTIHMYRSEYASVNKLYLWATLLMKVKNVRIFVESADCDATHLQLFGMETSGGTTPPRATLLGAVAIRFVFSLKLSWLFGRISFTPRAR